MKNLVHSHTPSVTVIDNRSLAIRQIDYHRLPDKPDETDEQITRHFFTVAGFPSQSLSPRQFDLQQKNPSLMPNRQTIYSLSGESLQTDSTDEGTHLILKDIAQRPHFSLNANSVKRWWQYEAETLPGRELSITEQAPEEAVRITERFIWAGNSQNEKNDNLSGICRHHYHTAGKDTIERIAITGALLREARQLIVSELEVD